MKYLIGLLAVCLFAADVVDTDKLTIRESQLAEANAKIEYQTILADPAVRVRLAAVEAAQAATLKVIEARAIRLGCPGKLDLRTLECQPAQPAKEPEAKR